MRIALCLADFDPSRGGEAGWTWGFACFLRDRGHHVHVVARHFADLPERVRSHLVAPSISPLGAARRVARVLADLRVDAVHDAGTTVWPGISHPHAGSNLVSLDRLIATEPPLRRLRASVSPKMAWLRAEMAWLERKQASAARTIVAVSPLVAELLAQRHPLARQKIVTVMNGIDIERFRPLEPSGASPDGTTDTRDGRGGGPVRFLFAAHNPRLKGLDTALQALSFLARDGIDARLTVAGVDASNAPAVPPDIAARTTFLGVVPDLAPLHAQSDALVHPTRSDACSLVVLEAMASGLPVITTARDGASGAMISGESGLVLSRPDDGTALASAMRHLCDPATRRSIGTKARAAVVPLTLERNYGAVEALLLAAAAQSSA